MKQPPCILRPWWNSVLLRCMRPQVGMTLSLHGHGLCQSRFVQLQALALDLRCIVSNGKMSRFFNVIARVSLLICHEWMKDDEVLPNSPVCVMSHEIRYRGIITKKLWGVAMTVKHEDLQNVVMTQPRTTKGLSWMNQLPFTMMMHGELKYVAPVQQRPIMGWNYSRTKRNCISGESKKQVSMNAKTGLTRYWRIYQPRFMQHVQREDQLETNEATDYEQTCTYHLQCATPRTAHV